MKQSQLANKLCGKDILWKNSLKNVVKFFFLIFQTFIFLNRCFLIFLFNRAFFFCFFFNSFRRFFRIPTGIFSRIEEFFPGFFSENLLRFLNSYRFLLEFLTFFKPLEKICRIPDFFFQDFFQSFFILPEPSWNIAWESVAS